MEDPSKVSTLMWSSPRPSILARRVRNAVSMQAARSRETPQAAMVRREQNAARMEMLRSQEPEEKAAERRARNAAAMQAARAKETPEQTAARRAQNAARMVALRARETAEQRAIRRSLNAARMQASRARDHLHHSDSNVGINTLIEDDVMRKAVLAAHRQPLKKRKDIMIFDLDQQQRQMHEAADGTVEANPTPLPERNMLESGDGAVPSFTSFPFKTQF